MKRVQLVKELPTNIISLENVANNFGEYLCVQPITREMWVLKQEPMDDVERCGWIFRGIRHGGGISGHYSTKRAAIEAAAKYVDNAQFFQFDSFLEMCETVTNIKNGIVPS